MYAHDRGLARASLSFFDEWQGAGWHGVAVVVGSGSLLNLPRVPLGPGVVNS